MNEKRKESNAFSKHLEIFHPESQGDIELYQISYLAQRAAKAMCLLTTVDEKMLGKLCSRVSFKCLLTRLPETNLIGCI